ncbi:hypothetical protein GM30_24065 [Trabulsiella odontotermitis]|nr:hypothetical protein GM30_24065 [Trabulsiella odontotermitis]
MLLMLRSMSSIMHNILIFIILSKKQPMEMSRCIISDAVVVFLFALTKLTRTIFIKYISAGKY